MNTLERQLAGAANAAGPAVDRLRGTLARRAQQQDLLDVAYRAVDTSVGSLLLAATPAGLIRVAYAVQDHEAVLAALAERVSPRVLLAPGKLDDAARQLDDYLTGRRRGFDLPLDLRLARGFRRSVLERLPDIGYGRTASYAEIAAAARSPRAVRAVGSACAANPLPLILPCHRVVRGDGTPGGYVGGPEVKLRLLDLERAAGRQP